MSIYGKPLKTGGGRKPSQLNVTTNGSWSTSEGYSPVIVNVPPSAVTSGTLKVVNNGAFNVTEYQNINAQVPPSAVTSGTLDVVNNGVFNVAEYQKINVQVTASAVTSGTMTITADGDYDVTNFKSVVVATGN